MIIGMKKFIIKWKNERGKGRKEKDFTGGSIDVRYLRPPLG